MAKGASRLMGILSALLLGCESGPVAGGAGAGNPPSPIVEVAFSVQAVSKSPVVAQAKGAASRPGNPLPALSVRDSAGTVIRLDSLRLLTRALEIGLPEGRNCADAKGLVCRENEVYLAGPFDFNLLTETATPPLAALRLPFGVYRQVGLEPLEQGGASDTVGGDRGRPNLFLRGSISPPGSAPKTFVLEIELEDGIDFIHPSGVAARPDSLNALTLALVVDGWFAGVDMAACLTGGEAKADSVGVLHVRGNSACGGIGFRMQKSIDESGNLVEGEEEEEREE